jgi:hypothetical protein
LWVGAARGGPSFSSPFRWGQADAKPPKRAAESRWATTPALLALMGGLHILRLETGAHWYASHNRHSVRGEDGVSGEGDIGRPIYGASLPQRQDAFQLRRRQRTGQEVDGSGRQFDRVFLERISHDIHGGYVAAYGYPDRVLLARPEDRE